MKASRLITLFLVAFAALPASASRASDFGPPQPVLILNHPGSAMEPHISRDGSTLFFNNSNAPGQFTDLYYARRVRDGIFLSFGRVRGVNAPPPALDAVASMDLHGRFYFVSTRNYETTLNSLFAGQYLNGAVSGIQPVAGNVSRNTAGWLTMDAEISPDGGSLYFVDALFNGTAIPVAADLVLALRQPDGRFLRAADSALLFQSVNSADLEYAPAIAASGLELFFTRYTAANNRFAILRTTRGSTAEPFSAPAELSTLQGIVEAPSLSSDGRTLYFHKKVGARYVIQRSVR